MFESAKVLSSQYVLEQLRATFMRAAVLLHAHLLETRNVQEVLRRTDEYKSFTQGEGAKARKILARLLSAENSDVDDKLATLERLIEHDIMGRFRRLAGKVDSTSCCQSGLDPIRDGNGFFQFKSHCALRDPRPCFIEAFWKERHAGLLALANTTTDVPEPARKVAAEVIKGELPRGKRCYVSLSDAVIVAESPPGSMLLTSNLKDFVPLSRVIRGDSNARDYPR